jgi:hypothetical protein
LFAIGSFISDTKLPNLTRKQIKEFLGKESFLHQFAREIFSLRAIKKGFLILDILNYTGFIFIPIVAAKNNLNLSQIAIIFAIMRLPYVINFFTGELVDRYNKNKFIIIVFLFLSFLFALL